MLLQQKANIRPVSHLRCELEFFDRGLNDLLDGATR